MIVLSLFDGIGCGMVALERAGIKVDKYYASEIDKYAIKIAKKNYPQIIELGDINNWRQWDVDWDKIDLVIGGSPCQGFSNAGKGLNFNDPRSALFFKYVEILNHIKNLNCNIKFLLENVKMKKQWIDIISEYLQVNPVLINSALVSAQNRQRYYWTNISNISLPQDKGISLQDVLLTKIFIRLPQFGSPNKSRPLNAFYQNNFGGWYLRINNPNPNKQQLDIIAEPVCDTICKNDELKHVYYSERGSTNTVFQIKNKTIILYNKPYHINLDDGFWRIRKILPIECERLQTLPDNYTAMAGISNAQRYKMIGNGWTVDVIAHIFKSLQDTAINNK